MWSVVLCDCPPQIMLGHYSHLMKQSQLFPPIEDLALHLCALQLCLRFAMDGPLCEKHWTVPTRWLMSGGDSSF